MTINCVTTEDDLLHWANGPSAPSSLKNMKRFAREAVAEASQASSSWLCSDMDIEIQDVMDGYKVCSGYVLLSMNISHTFKPQNAPLLSRLSENIIAKLGVAGAGTSIVLCRDGRAVAAITSSASPGHVFFQGSDDFDPARPNAASSLDGAQVINTIELPRAVGEMLKDLATAPPSYAIGENQCVIASRNTDPVSREAARFYHGNEMSSLSPDVLGVRMKNHVHRTSEVAERLQYLASDAFVAKLTDTVEQAVKAAVARHHEAGLSVHGERSGVIIEVPPPTN